MPRLALPKHNRVFAKAQYRRGNRQMKTNRGLSKLGLLLVSMLLIGLVTTKADAKNCDQKCLRAVTDHYLAALIKHDASKLPMANNVKFTENGRVLALNEGLWKRVNRVGAYREYFADASTGNALFIGVLDEGGASAILAARLKVVDGQVTEIETVVARKGSEALFTPERMTTADALFAAAVPEETRVPRARMIEIAKSYFDGLEQSSSTNIPATLDCDRYENGTQTTQQASTSTAGNCAKSVDAINYIKAVKNRRCFIVDESTGVVACTIVFDISGGGRQNKPRMQLLTQVFKIDGGNIARIQAVTHNLPHGSKSGWEK